MHGVGSGLMWSGFVTFLVQLAPAGERGSVLALRYTSANVAFGLGALITAFVTVGEDPSAYVTILLADAASYLLFALTMVLLASRLREPGTNTTEDERGDPGTDPQERVGYGQVLRDRALLGARPTPVSAPG